MNQTSRVSGGFIARMQPKSSIIFAANKAARIRLGLLLLFVAIAACSMFAATTGSISGAARDAQGAVIPNAKVELRNTLTGVIQSVTTDSAGFYNFPSLPIGHYDITFESAGFDKYVEKDIVIDVDTQRRVDAALKPGGVSEQVTVTATADQAQVDTETSQMGEVIGSAEIEAVPLDGRSYTDLLALQPGVVPINVQWYNSVTPPNGINNGELSIAGAQDVHSGFYVNGANAVDGAGEGTFLIPTLDSIAEFRIVTNNAGAEYGGYAGGITNVVTKSGTNQFHGDAFEYLRNASLNAKSYNNDPTQALPPALHQNIFGGTVGGPILRNKIFFFGDYQGLRNSDGYGINAGVLTNAERGGDLGEEASGWTSSSVHSDYMASVLNTRLGIDPNSALAIKSGTPYYTPSCTDTSMCVFPKAVIPTNAMDPVAKFVIDHYLPVANGTSSSGLPVYTNNSLKTTWTENKGAARVDGTTRLGQVSGYWHYDPWENIVPSTTGPTVPGFPGEQVGAAQLAVASLTTPIGSTAVNNFVASWTYNRNIIGPLPSSAPEPLSAFGFLPASQGGIAQVSVGQWQMMPSFNWKGLGPNAFNVSYVTTQYNNVYQGQEDFSKVYKTHSFKVGAQYHWDHVNIGKPQNASNGIFSTGHGETGIGDADFMLGAISNVTQALPAFIDMRNFYAGLYGEDSWRVSKDLTLNYGLRWEVNPFWAEAHNHTPMIVPGMQSTLFPNAPPGYMFPGEQGIPHHLANINWHDFGPRVGAAYTPDFGNNPVLRAIFGNYGKSSVRAGYGMYYTNIEGYNTWNLSAAPYGLYTVTSWSGFMSAPYIDRADGSQHTNPFPPDPNTYNWSLSEPFKNFRSPTLHEASPYEEHVDFSVQREITAKTILQVAYVGAFGHHLTVVADNNAGDPALALYLMDPNNIAQGGTYCSPGCDAEEPSHVYHGKDGNTYHGTRRGLNDPPGTVQSQYAYRAEGSELNVGNSAYHAFETTVRHNTDRSTLLFSYTWSKAIDNGSGRGDIIFPEKPNYFRGLSLYDVPQNLAVTYSYELPFDKFIHASDRLTRGWKFSGTTRASNGVPIWMWDGNDENLRGDFMSAWGGPDTNVPSVQIGAKPYGDKNPRHPDSVYLNWQAYSEPNPGTQGNAPRRSIIGPGINNTDLAIMKDVKLKEGITLQLRAEFFNAWNHAQWYGSQIVTSDFENGPPFNPDGSRNTNSNFGMVSPTSANDMRKGQLNATIHF